MLQVGIERQVWRGKMRRRRFHGDDGSSALWKRRRVAPPRPRPFEKRHTSQFFNTMLRAFGADGQLSLARPAVIGDPFFAHRAEMIRGNHAPRYSYGGGDHTDRNDDDEGQQHRRVGRLIDPPSLSSMLADNAVRCMCRCEHACSAAWCAFENIEVGQPSVHCQHVRLDERSVARDARLRHS